MLIKYKKMLKEDNFVDDMIFPFRYIKLYYRLRLFISLTFRLFFVNRVLVYLYCHYDAMQIYIYPCEPSFFCLDGDGSYLKVET